MPLDPLTMLTLSVALAAAAALYLAIEWRSIREPSLLFWSAGFATISVGSTLALLRSSGFLLIGIWFANGLLVTAHFLFLLGVARFTQTRLSRGWWLIFIVWLAMLLTVSKAGIEHATTLISGPIELVKHGLWPLGLVVFFTTAIAPSTREIWMISPRNAARSISVPGITAVSALAT